MFKYVIQVYVFMCLLFSVICQRGRQLPKYQSTSFYKTKANSLLNQQASKLLVLLTAGGYLQIDESKKARGPMRNTTTNALPYHFYPFPNRWSICFVREFISYTLQ